MFGVHRCVDGFAIFKVFLFTHVRTYVYRLVERYREQHAGDAHVYKLNGEQVVGGNEL